jgi:hypothetical protein
MHRVCLSGKKKDGGSGTQVALQGASFAGWFFWLPRLLLILLQKSSLEF